jgi:hypothetical protein
MAFDDLPLGPGEPGSQPPGSRPASPTRWIVVGAVALAMGSLIYFWWISRAQPQPATPAPTTETDVAVRSHRPKRQPMELPELDVSDAFVRDLVQVLSQHPLLARLLATKDLVRSAALTVEQIGDGKTPAAPLRVLRPDTRLAIVSDESGRIAPGGYTRWNAATTTLTSIRPNEAAQLYVNVKPLFDAAYHELGHPTTDFDAAIVRAIQELRDTPVPAGEPTLLRKPGYFEHADPALAALPPAQKQFLLLGSENRQRVLDWLKQFADTLELKID